MDRAVQPRRAVAGAGHAHGREQRDAVAARPARQRAAVGAVQHLAAAAGGVGVRLGAGERGRRGVVEQLRAVGREGPWAGAVGEPVDDQGGREHAGRPAGRPELPLEQLADVLQEGDVVEAGPLRVAAAAAGVPVAVDRGRVGDDVAVGPQVVEARVLGAGTGAPALGGVGPRPARRDSLPTSVTDGDCLAARLAWGP